MKPGLKNTNDKSACVNIFSELLLTEKFRYYLRRNATSYNDHILITYHILIAYISCIASCITLITSSYIDFYNSAYVFNFYK